MGCGLTLLLLLYRYKGMQRCLYSRAHVIKTEGIPLLSTHHIRINIEYITGYKNKVQLAIAIG